MKKYRKTRLTRKASVKFKECLIKYLEKRNISKRGLSKILSMSTTSLRQYMEDDFIIYGFAKLVLEKLDIEFDKNLKECLPEGVEEPRDENLYPVFSQQSSAYVSIERIENGYIIKGNQKTIFIDEKDFLDDGKLLQNLDHILSNIISKLRKL